MAKNGKFLQVFFASRLVHEKGVDILIEGIIAAQSDPLLKDVHWHICSDGVFTGAIRSLAEQYPENVVYYGKVGFETMRDLYRESDYLLMPSRFLETFGLTALEALACGTPVIGIRKGSLVDFISEDLALDESDPVYSLLCILREHNSGDPHEVISVSQYGREHWMNQLDQIFLGNQRIFLIHDYDDLIGGAEYYIEMLIATLRHLGKEVEFYGYHGKTSIWKRRLMFMSSPLAFWHGIALRRQLLTFKPNAIWMHSILRYVGIWGIREIQRYADKKTLSLFLSHHDVGLLAAFPQYITNESEIPENTTQSAFLRGGQSWIYSLIARVKWHYVRGLKLSLPRDTKHIIFSSFLEKHIEHHFPDSEILILPHPVDRRVFHP